MPEEKKIQGWADVQLSVDVPVTILVNFLNVLNQRLVALENVTQVPYENRMITLTELYAIQNAEAIQRQEAAQKAQEDVLPDNPEHQGA